MGYLYILQSEKNGKYYIGSTNNLERRLKEHNSGQTPSLVNILPVKLVFKQIYDTLLEARQMEVRLKKFKNRNIIEKIIKEKAVRKN